MSFAPPPPIPPEVADAIFALHYEDLFIGTAFAIAPHVALTTGHHIRIKQDDIGKLNLRKLNVSSPVSPTTNNSGSASSPSSATSCSSSSGASFANAKENEDPLFLQQKPKKKPVPKRRLRPEDEEDERRLAEEKSKNIVAVPSYAQKERESDVLVLWLDRAVPFYPLRAHHPPEGTAVMMISAATSPPHHDFVVSAGKVSRSPAPDALTACCRATGLVSARGYSGSVVMEMPNSSDTLVFPSSSSSSSASCGGKPGAAAAAVAVAAPEKVTLPPRILGMHVSIYKNDNDPDAINLIEFVSAYRILKMLCLYNVDPHCQWALKGEEKTTPSSKKAIGRSFF